MDRRYEFLDGLRGVAAIVVMLMHFLSPLGWEAGIVPHAHLAVDFFFCLSGFVLTHAYGGMLASGRPMLRRFYLGRAIRCWCSVWPSARRAC
jgi:peptidoglycan/LPS O-acetylase OafA/YrhL